MFRKADIEAATPDFWSLGGINFQGDVTMWTNLLAQGDLLYLTETLSQSRQDAQSIQDRGGPRLAQGAWRRLTAGAAELGLYRPGELAVLDARPLQSDSPGGRRRCARGSSRCRNALVLERTRICSRTPPRCSRRRVTWG